ncbi:MAG: hypothetical protein ACE5F9_01970 [Phycisphaerae bacterium]
MTDGLAIFDGCLRRSTGAAGRARLAACCAGIGLVLNVMVASLAAEQPSGRPTSQPAKVLDEDLVRRLMGGETTAVDAVHDTLEQMDRATQALARKLDPGEDTQRVQARIILGIDRLIAQARMAGSKRQRGSRRARSRKGRPRGKPVEDASKASDAARPQPAAAQRSGQGSAAGPDADASDHKKTGAAGLARGWGFLPPRDRDEIVQGFGEEFLSKYRDMILRYYRLLARRSEEE